MASDRTISLVDHIETRRPAAASERVIIALNAARPLEQPASFSLADVDEVSFGRGAARAAAPAGLRRLRIDLADAGVSVRHAVMRRDAAGWKVVDEGSKNGTLVNGRRVAQAALGPDDLIELGSCFLFVRSGAAASGLLPPPLRTFNAALAARLEVFARVARSQVPLLIFGESGTGKEVLARAAHELSGRAGPFVALNCGAVPESLIESELFGARKGAFSGAGVDREGTVAAAHRGTLLLDEIAELAEPSQVALLRVLQEGEVVALGSTKAVKVDVRVIAATHQSLDERVADGRFRQDLYARLAGDTLTLPPLRERREDLGLLCAELLPRIAGARAAALTFQREAARAMLGHSWPNNIRELGHVLARAVALLDGDELRLEHLPESFAPAASGTDEREQLVELLRAHRGNVSAVARVLQTSRSHVHRLIRRHGIDAVPPGEGDTGD